MPWDLVELRSHYITTNPHGSDLPSTLISSLSRLTDIFRYHMFLARDAGSSFFDPHNPDGVDTLLLLFGQSTEQENFTREKIASEANMIGFIHATRGLLDIFAQLINELILRPKLKIETVYIVRVNEALPTCRLKVNLNQVLNSKSFQYVNAFVNTTKHRQLVPHVIHVSDNVSGLRLASFTYGKTMYPSYSIKEALEVVLEVANTLVDAGPLLNDYYIRGRR